MKTERWKQIDDILQSALDRDPRERPAFVENACAGDASLLGEVESLIKAHSEARSFIEAPLLEDSTKILRERKAGPDKSRLIGPYKIIREIGHGGMGTVFLATRADDQYRKAVAIKLIRRGMDTDSILRRFRHERQILASLDHPNIARLLEGGTTEDGLPYFVMEHIEGQTIVEYCDAQKLTTADRLKLFRTVCSAVHYAHQNLIVHRDIKPSNILVTSDGIPKLLDFGIAKLLKPEMYAQTIAPTETMVRPMTPDYASPEQVRGQPVTTSSDVYSLGVLLYELLTGHRPYRITGYTPQAIEQAICEQEPERPSTAISRTQTVSSSDGAGETALTPESVSRTREGQPDKLRRKLAGDLDNIVLMAMRKEPQRRYASAEQFSEDIRRHLEGLPVKARKDTFNYRAGKFVKRHKVGVAAIAAFVVLTVAAAVAIVIQSARASRERDKAQKVSAFLVDIFKVSDPSDARGKTITAREILDKGAERIERELQDQPDVQATLLDTIGNVYRALGLYERAIPLLEQSLKIRRETLGNENLDTAQTIYDLGYTLREKQKAAEAETLARESLTIRRGLLGNENAAVADSLNLIAMALWNKGDLAAAEPLLRESLALRRKVLGSVHHDVALSLNDLALVLENKGDYAAAEPLYQEAIATGHKLGEGEDTWLARYLGNYGVLKDKRGDYDAAESLEREGLAIQRKLLGNEHPDVAISLNNVAATLRNKGNYAEAESLYRQALQIGRKQYGEENQNVAIFTRNLARVLYEQGDFAQADPLYREAMAKFQRILGENHPRVCQARTGLAVLLYEKGDVKLAEEMLRQSLEAQRKAYPNGHQDMAVTEIALGCALTEHEHASEAEPLLRDALRTLQTIFPDNNWQLADARGALGECLAILKSFDDAEALLTRSYSTLKDQRSENDLYRRRASARLLSLYQGWGKPDKLAQYRAMTAR